MTFRGPSEVRNRSFQFVYLRELDLEKVNRGTVEKLAKHKQLKKLIVHGCRNYDVFQDFHGLPQLLVVKGEILGLKVSLKKKEKQKQLKTLTLLSNKKLSCFVKNYPF